MDADKSTATPFVGIEFAAEDRNTKTTAVEDLRLRGRLQMTLWQIDAACHESRVQRTHGRAMMAEQGFTLTSPAFAPDSKIPETFTCDGENRSPELQWIHPPSGARSFALIVEDPDAPGKTFTHWLLFDIPAEAKRIPDGTAIGVQGRNDFRQTGYGGPCPPPNHGEHRYFFRLIALDVESLELELGVTRAKVENAMEGHVIGQADLMGRFERKTG